MNFLGIGTDILNIKRFGGVLRRTPDMVERVFTQHENEQAQGLCLAKRTAYYAKRFAAKEAVSKACGTGIGARISWQDIEILNDQHHAPVVVFSPKAKRFLQKKFNVKTICPFISLSDETEYALAFVLLTDQSGGPHKKGLNTDKNL